MSDESINGQYRNPPFSMGGVDSTGAPGSETAPAASLPAGRTGLPFAPSTETAPVSTGPDMANPQYSHGTELGGVAGFGSTGAGQGSGHDPHPNAQG